MCRRVWRQRDVCDALLLWLRHADVAFHSSCNAPDGTEITLLREGAEDGAEEDHDHAEEDHDHSHNNSTSTAIPTAVSNCHAHDEGIFCFADDEEWEITSENAASYEGQNLTACASSAMNTTTM